MGMERLSTLSELGLGDTVKTLASSLLEGFGYRLDLLGMEYQEEKQRFFGLLCLTLLATFSAFLSFLALNLLVVVLFWDTHRLTVVVSLAVLYALAAITASLVLRRRLRSAPDAFSASLSEFRKDYAAMGGDDR